MDAILTKKAEELAKDLAGQATTLNELNAIMRSLMKSALERMLNTEMFELPMPIQKATYTTNVIESVNSVIRKFTRNRKQYPNRDSAMKLIYMAIHEASKKWTMPFRNNVRRPNAKKYQLTQKTG